MWNKPRLFYISIILAGLFITSCFFISASAQSPLKENKSIRVGIDSNYPPFSFIDGRGNLQGIDIDQWKLWEQKTGIPVEFVVVGMDQAPAQLQSGQLDVISELFSTPERESVYDFSEPYYPVDVSVFFTKNISGISDVESMRGFVVAVVAGYDSADYLKSRGITVREYPATEAMIVDAKAGNVSVFCTDTPAAVYYLYKFGIQSEFLTTQPLYTNDLRRAVLKGNSALLREINDGFAQISPEEYKAIRSRWSGTRVYSSEETERMFLSGLLVAIVTLIGLALIALWNRTLHKTVDRRTADLTQKTHELEIAYEQLAATEEMLRSHYEDLSRKEQELRESEKKYRSIFSTFIDIYYQTDMQGVIITISPSCKELSGWEQDELLGRNVLELYPTPRQRKALLEQLLRNGYVHDFEVLLKNREGRPVPVSVNSHVIYDNHGNPERIEGTIRDISERKAAEEALVQARKKLNLLNSVTFQDIQEALFSLDGYLELQNELPLDAKASAYVKKEREVAEKISTTLAFAKNYQDMGFNPPLWQNANQVFLLAISHLDLSKIARNVSLDNLELYADPLLETVFFNLVENVTRHGKTATEISLHYQETTDSLTLFIEDNGAGIPDADKERIFERGYGAQKGMGLFLVREILGITAISITESGTYGKGARFEIAVPKGAYRFSDVATPR